jgi:hypothetical protein
MYNENTAPPPRSGNKTLLIILLVIGIPCVLMIVLGAVGFFSCMRLMKGTIMPMVSCSIAYDEVREAMRMYAKDHDGKLPNAATWEDDIRPYYAKVDLIKGENKDAPSAFKIEKMPINGPWGCKINDTETTGMAFNKTLSGKKLAEIENSYGTVLLFEVPKSGKNLSEVYAPRSTADAPKLFGESRGWMYIFVDGKNPFSTKGNKIGDNSGMPPVAPEKPTGAGASGDK